MTKYDLSMTKYKFAYFVKTIYNLSRQNMVCLTSYFVIDIYTLKQSDVTYMCTSAEQKNLFKRRTAFSFLSSPLVFFLPSFNFDPIIYTTM